MADLQGNVTKLTNDIKDNIRKISKKLNQDGLRVLAK